MLRRLIPVSVGVATIITGVLVAQGRPAAAASGGGCALQGSANLSPGLSTTAQSFTYTFSGGLSSCKASDSTAPATGNVAAGLLYGAVTSSGPDPNNPTVTITHTEHFYEPVSTGSGTCGSSTTSGTAFITWGDGTVTVISYSTTGAGAEVALQGTVIAGAVLTAPDHTYTWEPTTLNVSTTRYSGSNALAELVFQATPTDCSSPTGVQTAGITGTTLLGSPN